MADKSWRVHWMRLDWRTQDGRHELARPLNAPRLKNSVWPARVGASIKCAAPVELRVANTSWRVYSMCPARWTQELPTWVGASIEYIPLRFSFHFYRGLDLFSTWSHHQVEQLCFLSRTEHYNYKKIIEQDIKKSNWIYFITKVSFWQDRTRAVFSRRHHVSKEFNFSLGKILLMAFFPENLSASPLENRSRFRKKNTEGIHPSIMLLQFCVFRHIHSSNLLVFRPNTRKVDFVKPIQSKK